jgi:hypothetical protein
MGSSVSTARRRWRRGAEGSSNTTLTAPMASPAAAVAMAVSNAASG